MRTNHITIKDLARVLNLSISTISRALNDQYDVRKETRNLVLKTAKELGYRPNPIAKKLIQRRTFNVGVVIPEFQSSFFTKLILGIQDFLIKNKYQVLIMSSNESHETELENIKTLEDNMVDGLIISLSKETKNIDYINNLIKGGLPVILINRINKDIKAPSIVFDDYKWAFFATEHLISQGCQKIVHFATPPCFSLSQNRIKGFIAALEKHGISYSSDQIIACGMDLEDGEEAIKSILNNELEFDGIFAGSDRAAIGAIKYLKKLGVRIPEQVCIIGFSESSLAQIIDPALSSVLQPTYEMGKAAAELLVQSIDTEKIESKEIVLGGKLNIRESSLRK